MIRKILFLFLLTCGPLFAQTNTFPFMNSGTEAAKPATCTVPSFYFATDSGILYSCANGAWFQVGNSSTAAPVVSAAVSPSSTLNFGTVQNNTPSVAQIATIANTGTTTLVVNSASFTSGTKFSSPNINACKGSLLAGAACSLLIQYTPTSGSTDTDTLTFLTNAPVTLQNPLTVALSGSGTATATFPVSLIGLAGLGSGTVVDTNTANSLNGTFTAGVCSGTCTLNYPTGTTVILTATPDALSTFGTFGGAGLTTSPGTFVVSQAQTVSATFNLAPVNNQATIAATGQGSGTVTTDAQSTNGILNCKSLSGVTSSGGNQGCNGPFTQGTVITFTEVPSANNSFVGWIGAPGCTTASTCQITLNADQTVTANFASTTTIPITLVQTVTSPSCTTSGTTTVCPWASAQSAGDFLVIGIGIPDASTTIVSVTDTKGNTYTQVPTISPKVGTNLTQAIYYAQNIVAAAAGANTTTVTYSSSVATAIVGTNLTTAADGSTASTEVSPSVTCTNNTLDTVATWAQLASGNGPGAVSTVAGCGLTWVKIAAIDFGSTQGTGKTTRSEVWRSLGTGSSGAITVTWGVSSTGRSLSISKFSGVDTTGSNGSGAVGSNIATNFGGLSTTATVTMGTFAGASNGTYGMAGTSSNRTATAGTSMTLLGHDGNNLVSDEWAAGNVSPVTTTFPTNVLWGTIGFEIIAAGSSGRRDVRALEYSGVLQSGGPVDVSAAAVGTSATAAPGSMTTTVANDLVTDFNLSNQSVNTPATNFTQRVKNSFGDDEEDIQGVATGAQNPSVALTSSGNWVASQVSFKPQTSQLPTVFSVTVNTLGNGSGVTVSNIGNPLINCPGACSSQVTSGATDILTAQANPGSVFVQWSGITGCGTSAQCIVPNITSNQNVSATYALSGTSNYYVATTGSDSTGTGAQASPWATINKAISAFTLGPGGATIHVANGTYSGVTVTRGGSSSTVRLVMQCDNGVASYQAAVGKCMLTASGIGFTLSGGNNFDIKGFDIGGNANQTVAIDGIPCGTTGQSSCLNSVHILGNYIHDLAQNAAVDGNGCNIPGGAPAAILILNAHNRWVTDLQLIGNFIKNYGPNPYPQSCQQSNYGMYIDTQNAIIENNLIVRVGVFGIQNFGQPCGTVVSNNTFVNMQYAMTLSGDGEGICSRGIVTVNNNIMVGMTKGVLFFISQLPCTDGAHQSFFGNNISDGAVPDFVNAPALSCNTTLPGTGNPGTLIHASGASLFVNYQTDGSGNYQLKSTSLAINGGTAQCVTGAVINPCIPGTDILGVSRPQRATFDVGAFELP